MTGAVAAGIAVMLGALGAHALRSKLDESSLNAFNTAVQYQMVHALALLLVGLMIYLFPTDSLFKFVAALFVAGILFFSGSLYALAFTQIKLFGPITPIGGLAFIAGWLLLAYAFYRVV